MNKMQEWNIKTISEATANDNLPLHIITSCQDKQYSVIEI